MRVIKKDTMKIKFASEKGTRQAQYSRVFAQCQRRGHFSDGASQLTVSSKCGRLHWPPCDSQLRLGTRTGQSCTPPTLPLGNALALQKRYRTHSILLQASTLYCFHIQKRVFSFLLLYFECVIFTSFLSIHSHLQCRCI